MRNLGVTGPKDGSSLAIICFTDGSGFELPQPMTEILRFYGSPRVYSLILKSQALRSPANHDHWAQSNSDPHKNTFCENSGD